jgi:hypothetical protein
MNKTELLEMALEKLTAASNYIDTLGGVSKGYRMDIERLKAALEAKDEPVAWFWFDERDGGEWIHIADNQINADKFGNAKVIPLYTTPPQRKPLMIDSIIELAQEIDWPAGAYIDFARAIESAHGIKEKA